MGKSKPPSQPGSRLLSDEDRDAWERTAQTFEPLNRKRRQKREIEPLPPIEPAVTHPPAAPPRRPPHAVPPPPRDELPPLAGIGRRQTRKLSTGQVSIDGRVDLHGMTQAEAHGALRQFLVGAHERDARWVLVITGKGSRRKAGRSEVEDSFMPRESGILRRNVPLWLEQSDLRDIVIAFRTAAQAHGGDGALYVQLRQRRRPER